MPGRLPRTDGQVTGCVHSFGHRQDGAGADVVSESGELALDAAVSPARVFLCKADNELTELAVDARATGAVRVGPFLGDQASVPGQ